jgi:hypothetical protein
LMVAAHLCTIKGESMLRIDGRTGHHASLLKSGFSPPTEGVARP